MFPKNPPPPHPPLTRVEQPCEATVTPPQMSGCGAEAAQRHFRLLFISEGDATMSASNIKHAVITLNQRLASDGAAGERSDSSHITDGRAHIPNPSTRNTKIPNDTRNTARGRWMSSSRNKTAQDHRAQIQNIR